MFRLFTGSVIKNSQKKCQQKFKTIPAGEVYKKNIEWMEAEIKKINSYTEVDAAEFKKAMQDAMSFETSPIYYK